MMETQNANNEEKKSEKANPFPRCCDFQKLAEMMKNCCPTEDGTIDCCSMASRMMGHFKEAEAQETKEKQTAQTAEKTAET